MEVLRLAGALPTGVAKMLDPANDVVDARPIEFSEPDAKDDVKPDELSGVVATADNLQFIQ